MMDSSIQNNDNIMDIMDSCFSYNHLHELLVEKVEAFLSDNSYHVIIVIICL